MTYLHRMTFTPGITHAPSGTAAPFLFLFTKEGTLLLTPENLPPTRMDANAVYLGTLDGRPCFVARAEQHDPECVAHEIRSLYGLVPDELYALIGYATQILTWRETHRYCSKCGGAAKPSKTERAMICTACGFHSYPRISPSIIVAVTKWNELLMCRGHHFPAGLYSVVAGFVEPGETLEQCAAREVMEETGIEIKNIRYHSSQPWPFPHSLMVGFTADYAGGTLQIDPKEIEDAGWYTAGALPNIPGPSTIARTLFDHFLNA